MKLTSGLALAALSVSVPMRKPIVTMTSKSSSTSDWMFDRVVGDLLGDDHAVLAAQLGRGVHGALVRELVERAVLELADVGHDADPQPVARG